MNCDAPARPRRESEAAAHWVSGGQPSAARSRCHGGAVASGASKRLVSKVAAARGSTSAMGDFDRICLGSTKFGRGRSRIRHGADWAGLFVGRLEIRPRIGPQDSNVDAPRAPFAE